VTCLCGRHWRPAHSGVPYDFSAHQQPSLQAGTPAAIRLKISTVSALTAQSLRRCHDGGLCMLSTTASANGAPQPQKACWFCGEDCPRIDKQFTCKMCSYLQAPHAGENYFELFGLCAQCSSSTWKRFAPTSYASNLQCWKHLCYMFLLCTSQLPQPFFRSNLNCS
jgi:hypothetical protein